MASTWDNAWEGEVSNATPAAQIDDEINDTRETVRKYAAREHLVDLDNDDEADLWKHKAGSARAYVQSAAPSASGLTAQDQGKIWIKTQDHGQTDESTPTPDNVIEIYVWVWDDTDDEGAWQPYADPTMTGAICYFAADPPNISELSADFPWIPLDGTGGESGNGTVSESDYNGLYYRLVKHLNSSGNSAVLPNIDGEYIRVVKSGDTADPDPSQGSESDAYTHYGSQIPRHTHTASTKVDDDKSKHTHSTTEEAHSHGFDSLTGGGGLSGSGHNTATSGEADVDISGTEDIVIAEATTDLTIDASDDSRHQHDITIETTDDTEEAKSASPDSIFNTNDEVVPPSIVMRAYIHA